MEEVDSCFICGASDDARNLCVWFVNCERRIVHIVCWIAAHQAAAGDEQTRAINKRLSRPDTNAVGPLSQIGRGYGA